MVAVSSGIQVGGPKPDPRAKSRERMERFVAEVLRAHKLPARDAQITARVLVAADLRGIASHGVGVERTFLLRSPRIEKIEVLRHAKVRRAQLYYMRDRRGKAARLRERRS